MERKPQVVLFQELPIVVIAELLLTEVSDKEDTLMQLQMVYRTILVVEAVAAGMAAEVHLFQVVEVAAQVI